MKIGIITRGPELYSTKRLVEAAEGRGHEVVLINPLFCYMDITSNRPSMHYRGKTLEGFDAIIPRIGASVTFYGTAVVRQFEMMGVYCVNESVAISRSRDKLRSLQLLARKGIGLPVTSFAHSTKSTEDLIAMVGGPPLIVKLLEGTQGKGVVLAETQKAAESTIEAFPLARSALSRPGVYQGSGGGRLSLLRYRRQGRGLDEAAGAKRASFARTSTGAAAPPSSRLRRRSARPPCVRRTSWGWAWPAWTSCAPTTGRSSWRSTLRRSGRHREGNRTRHRREDHRLYRAARSPQPDADTRHRVTCV